MMVVEGSRIDCGILYPEDGDTMVYLHQTTRCRTEDSTFQHKFPWKQTSTAPTRKVVTTAQTDGAAAHFCSL